MLVALRPCDRTPYIVRSGVACRLMRQPPSDHERDESDGRAMQAPLAILCLRSSAKVGTGLLECWGIGIGLR